MNANQLTDAEYAASLSDAQLAAMYPSHRVCPGTYDAGTFRIEHNENLNAWMCGEVGDRGYFEYNDSHATKADALWAARMTQALRAR